ncbi:bifunctional 23S rRNA (guanine(2069)-N(7))-methyltransferase RlmK/23S rRNA (guanine(2445)-N(2))-methyltransferase RlmL [Solimonas sp. K1W22B-7]|uniref:bifunctional 23S rRNA (guanine(2069)-N(7))-methyltransferase RlmK/23S rRNA (guanine(2445)-N(2))-methyltransferase RlmL n=1 Tax=Solimonas sp. K1W22B-7 TaxID=2303331 RepID=UPI000E333A42|nr:bifunctional 23S rRNA (guanine(2069)-N(7))-methyltransferase RlmK/23S rRNA (guanine(2445)-N(2))-methyltransferase RlmL [Solimonas sp. K1W22B-7]AXQ28457.1 bifunctional 23S rRNA (guanine(2069)-N(7))-methyltransferase RlmK/23S rRNA (guanine(2445)-N(2))-methyltransferase RlmL [Solimonas sp. K1W22B-7]
MSAFPLFVTTPRGVEALLAAELTQLGATEVKERIGGVACQGDVAVAYRACLWSRLASRVLMPLRTFPLTGTDGLYTAARELAWDDLFTASHRFAIEVAGHSANVTHTHYAALKVKDAIVDHFRDTAGQRPDVDTDNPDIRIHLHLDKEQATLSLDLAGDSLHRRGYRLRGVEAPLKENLAAAILVRAGWPDLAAQGAGLVDPMCGSGTLVIEAAWMAGDVAPGLMREKWGFEAWLDHKPKVWSDLHAEALQRRSEGLKKLPPMAGSDIDLGALKSARKNAAQAGLTGKIDWTQLDALEARPVGEMPGLVVVNPPYGERLGAEGEIIKLYSLFGMSLKRQFPGWKAAVFTSRPDLGPRLGLRAGRMYSLFNGALACKLLNFDINPVSANPPPRGGEEYANRLQKNLKHLGKWAKRTGVSCYRVYDADLPDYAIAVDLYEADEQLHVHVQEYTAPKTIDPVKAEIRLREALAHTSEILEVPASRIHFKMRRSQKGTAQYEKHDEIGHFLEIDEYGCKLRVNFEDYLDTGVFLDHRPIRKRIQLESARKRFLNLFCYTGAATVHAALGGATESVSVDLSNTYLDWAAENLRLNGFDSQQSGTLRDRRDQIHRSAGSGGPWRTKQQAPHELVRADCMQWLKIAATKPGERYDLIFCDPPTFSNSKKMEGILDVQRDHVEMIQGCAALLAPGGVLYFSTNRRGFKLDEALLEGLQIKDITAQTLDEDFKRPPPAHRCWQIRKD